MHRLLLLSCLGLAVAGCAPDSGGANSTSEAPTPPSVPEIAGTDKPSGSIDVVAFKGGYDIDFYQQCAQEFDAKNPGVKSTVTGDPRVWVGLQPRMNSDSPPDLMFPGWGMDHWALAEEGQLMTLDKALDGPAPEGSGTWRDTFKPSVLKMGQLNGKQYVLPYYVNVQGWWYDPGVFAKNGWTPPKDFDELLTLCEKIKAKGMAPITYQGKYPYYMLEGMLWPWAISIGGIQVMNDAQNLVDGAWKSPAILQAAQMIKTLNDKGDFEKGAVGMTHTESQTEFVMGKAAMIPCGTWLSSEMKKTMPAGARMTFLLPPIVKSGKGDPTTLLISIEPWMVPAKAKNPNGAIALFKYMTSLSKAKQFVEQKGTPMAIKGSDDVKLPETMVGADEAFKNSKTVWAFLARQWYPKLETELENALTAMLNNQITPEQFCDRAQAAADKIKSDPAIAKPKV